MKTGKNYLIVLLFILLVSTEMNAQFGNGLGGGRFGNGRGRSAIPQAETPVEEPKPKTADELVDDQLPSIKDALELDEFETAIMSSVLKKYVQERIEAQILQLPPEKMREVYEKISERQDEELKAGLPLEKYEAFVQLQKDGVAKTLKENKKEEKKKKKKKDPKN